MDGKSDPRDIQGGLAAILAVEAYQIPSPVWAKVMGGGSDF